LKEKKFGGEKDPKDNGREQEGREIEEVRERGDIEGEEREEGERVGV